MGRMALGMDVRMGMEGMEEGPPQGKEPPIALSQPSFEHVAPPPGVKLAHFIRPRGQGQGLPPEEEFGQEGSRLVQILCLVEAGPRGEVLPHPARRGHQDHLPDLGPMGR